MTDQLPLGEREGQRLEFKHPDVLRNPEKVGREVVGMLNAQGGVIWIGIEEDHAVAVKGVSVPDPDRAERVLRDHLLATIDPSPGHDEVEISRVSLPTGDGYALCICTTPKRAPYAYRKQDWRYFGRRVGERLRSMSLQEIRDALIEGARSGERRQGAWTKAEQEVEGLLEESGRSSRPLIWLCIRPVVSLSLDLGRDVHNLFVDPDATGNRPEGWTFVDPRVTPRRKGKDLVHGTEGGRSTLVRHDGLILFSAPLELLYWKGEDRLIWPFVLIELPLSVFRLAARIYRPHSESVEDDRVAVRMALLSARGWRLKAGSVRSVRWQFGTANTLEETDLVTPIFEQRLPDLIDSPERCTYPLIREVYLQFGFDEKDIPPEFDPAGGLQFPA